MSTIKTIRQQLGQSGTAANNFTLDASADNGTMKLARGNAGATTQDIMTVDALGAVDFPQLVQSLGANGYKKLPGGLIIQWGTSGSGTADVSLPVVFPITFPNACFSVCGTPHTAAYTASINSAATVSAITTSGCTLGLDSWASAGPSAASVKWIAIGY